jgi:MoxR-like ATPase
MSPRVSARHGVDDDSFTTEGASMREEIRKIQALMEEAAYITEPAIATAVHLGMTLGKPLLVEGHAGVGKTEIAKVLARVLDTNLIRLQCYEGLDAATALYEWNYPKQLLRIKLEEREARSVAEKEADIFAEPFLLKRPLLQAITQHGKPPVLLVDEIDRSDLEFESFLLEVLSDFQVTIPEIGTIRATHRPHVVLTSNRSRDLSDALRRRCLYLWIDYPSFEKEIRILRTKVPGVNERLAGQVARAMQSLRRMKLAKVPGVAETLDWAAALAALHADHLDAELVRETLGCVLKEVEDVKRLEADLAAGRLSELLES